MQRKLSRNSYIAAKVAGIYLLGLAFGILLESCSDHMSQVYSPTSPSVNAVAKKGAVGKDTVSSINPQISGGYFSGQQVIAQCYLFDGTYLPEDSAKGKYLVLVGEPPNGDYTSMYNQYCFRRAVETSDQIPALIQAHFKLNEILIQIGFNNSGTGFLYSDWENAVNQYQNTVLGYWIDEPSGDGGKGIPLSTMQTVRDAIHAVNSTLWIEDNDTKVIPITADPLTLVANPYHPANETLLQYGDYIWNNGNTSRWISGRLDQGTQALQADYDEFQSWFGNRFDGIEAQAMDKHGALLNDAIMWDELENNSSINNFELAVGSTNDAIGGDYPDAVLASLPNFVADANYAGFLGHQNELWYYTYVCQQNDVRFVPPSSPAYNVADVSYYGISNGSYFTGPVDPSTPGAVLCWLLQSKAATGQIENVY